jgi:hypothetical protein
MLRSCILHLFIISTNPWASYLPSSFSHLPTNNLDIGAKQINHSSTPAQLHDDGALGRGRITQDDIMCTLHSRGR